MRKKNILIGILFVIIIVLIIILVKEMSQDNKDGLVIKNEISSNNELYPKDTKAMEIKTSYCNLCFPKKWEENLKIKNKEKDGNNSVEFWAKVDKKESVHIFDIMFGGEGYTVGTITDKNGKKIDINVKSYEPDLDDTWTDEEKNTIYAIGEDINYLLLELEKVEGFESVEK